MRLLKITTILTVALMGTTAQAQGLKAVAPLPGYACMVLNLTHEQMSDRDLVIPIFSAPSASSPQLGPAGAIVIARSPLRVANGMAEVLFPDGRAGWITANMLRPYQAASNPNARCTPSMMSNGKPGFG